MWQAIRPHLREPKPFLVWQVTPLQAAGALSAVQGGVLWPTKGRLRDKLWDDWGTNRTVTVWQTRQVLSDKLSSRCVTSYLSALVTSKTNSYATSLLQAAVALSASLGRVMWPTKGRLRDKLWDDWGTNRTVTVWQTIQVLSDKLSSRCVTSYLSALVTSKKDPTYATTRFIASCRCVVSKSRTRYATNQRAEAQTEQSLCDKLSRFYLTN